MSTLMGMLMSLREEMGAERAARKEELKARKEELEAERAARKEELEAERAARLELEKVVQTMKNQIAAEKSEHLDQLGEVENRAVELEDWVSTQVRPLLPVSCP
jgi:hypothetical protein